MTDEGSRASRHRAVVQNRRPARLDLLGECGQPIFALHLHDGLGGIHPAGNSITIHCSGVSHDGLHAPGVSTDLVHVRPPQCRLHPLRGVTLEKVGPFVDTVWLIIVPHRLAIRKRQRLQHLTECDPRLVLAPCQRRTFEH